MVASHAMTASATVTNFDAARPTVSRYIQILTEYELLNQEHNSRGIYYQLNPKKMEQKTKLHTEDGKQEIVVTREFDLPLELLFKAHAEPELIEQWMSLGISTTKVVKQENKKYGLWHYETFQDGKKVYGSSGAILEFMSNQKITRTFEIENAPFPVQLEFMEFEKITDNTSRLTMQMVFKSVSVRDQLLKMPFAQSINIAHNKLQEVLGNKK